MPRFAVLVLATVAIVIVAACSGDGNGPSGGTPAVVSPAQTAAPPAPAASPTFPTASATPQACDFETATQKVFASTVQVVTDEGAGTGYYIGDSRFLTAAHVVEGASEVQLLSPGFSATAIVVGVLSLWRS